MTKASKHMSKIRSYKDKFDSGIGQQTAYLDKINREIQVEYNLKDIGINTLEKNTLNKT